LWTNIFEKIPLAETLGGNFLEIGSYNGIKYSNTYFFEKKLDFRGVLIEGHPQNNIRSAQLKRNNSAIFTVAICDYVKNQPGNVAFTSKGGQVGADIAHASKGLLNR
jgi:hypothetical protein